MLSRIGHLLHDKEFNLDQFKQGGVNFKLRQSTEKIASIEYEGFTEQYSHIQCWNPVPIGWETIKFSEIYTKRFNLPDYILNDFREGRRHIIRKRSGFYFSDNISNVFFRHRSPRTSYKWFRKWKAICSNIIEK